MNLILAIIENHFSNRVMTELSIPNFVKTDRFNIMILMKEFLRNALLAKLWVPVQLVLI